MGVKTFYQQVSPIQTRQDLLDFHKRITDPSGFHNNSINIKDFQQRLTNAGFPVQIDGIFGPETQTAFSKLQQFVPNMESRSITGELKPTIYKAEDNEILSFSNPSISNPKQAPKLIPRKSYKAGGKFDISNILALWKK